MKFIRYSKFRGFDVSSIDLGGLMDALSNQMLDSGFHEDYWWTRQKNKAEDSLDALRQAILQALLDQNVLGERDVEQMLAENDGKFKGSVLEELINKLIERLVEEGYLNLKEVTQEQRREMRPGTGEGEVSEPLPRNIKFEITERDSISLATRHCRSCSAASGNHRSDGMRPIISTPASKPHWRQNSMNLATL
jgi:Ca-activated chloride channel family protein